MAIVQIIVRPPRRLSSRVVVFLVIYQKMRYFEPISRKIPTPTLSKLGWEHGAGDRARTGTMSPSRDFKSLASANSATPAYSVARQSIP